MKLVSFLLLTVILNSFSFAQDLSRSSHCSVETLYPANYEGVELFVSKNSSLLSTDDFKFSLTKKGESVQIKNFKVEMDKAVLVDEFTKEGSGLLGHFKSEVKVYGVKFHLSADEVIGHEIAGCIPQPVKELDIYLICKDYKTQFDR